MRAKKMWGKAVIIIVELLLFSGGMAQADYIDIYEDTVIDSDLDAIVTVHNSAEITVLPGGAATVFYLIDTSSALVYGGHASYRSQSSSVLDLYGGTFGSVGYDGSLAEIYVHGQNFQIIPASDNHTSVFLQGNWLNGTAFEIYFRDLPQPFEQALGTNIFLIPEPVTILLMLSGILGIRKLNR
ncbi:MAG: hypothetical protein JW804_03315 [Sedimentisphaerales bacterium]|nr:hypothetical protein [Sedimentisphaerales bacterium]